MFRVHHFVAFAFLALALLVPALLFGQAPNSAETLPWLLPRPGSQAFEQLPPAEARPLVLADIEQLALANNPTLARAVAHLEAARGEWVQAGLYPNPKAGIGEQQTGSNGRAEQDGVFFSQEFVLGHKLQLNRAVAEQALVQAQHQLAAQQVRVLTDARIAFYHVLIAQRQQQLAVELVAIAQRGVDAAKGKNKGTDVGENDVLEASIELHKAEIEARNARNRYVASWRSKSRPAPHRPRRQSPRRPRSAHRCCPFG